VAAGGDAAGISPGGSRPTRCSPPNPHSPPTLAGATGRRGWAELPFRDLDRRLPETDPFDRQITLGCGAFFELLTIAAAPEGYRADVTPSRMACRCRVWMSGLSQVLPVRGRRGREPDPAFALRQWTVARTGTRMTRARCCAATC